VLSVLETRKEDTGTVPEDTQPLEVPLSPLQTIIGAVYFGLIIEGLRARRPGQLVHT
jgi:hypothetical protein